MMRSMVSEEVALEDAVAPCLFQSSTIAPAFAFREQLNLPCRISTQYCTH
jgi:hypothetical protein